jgi:hypothetical protein
MYRPTAGSSMAGKFLLSGMRLLLIFTTQFFQIIVIIRGIHLNI